MPLKLKDHTVGVINVNNKVDRRSFAKGDLETLSAFAQRAVMAAFDVVRTTRSRYQGRAAGAVPINVGIGINSGQVVAGNIGSEKRMEYTVIGDTVNIAYRLEKSAGPQEIVISEDTYQQVEDLVDIVLEGYYLLKGKSHEIKFYTIREKSR